MDDITSILKATHSRRRFLAGASVAGAATLIGCNDPVVAPPITTTPVTTTPVTTTPVTTAPTTATTTPVTPPLTDNDILNFALNLEYLEAEFYLRAATGTGLSSTDSGGTGTVTGGTMVPGMNAEMTMYVNEIAQDELRHVRFLRQAITANKGTPVSRPNIDFTNAFNALALAAGIGPAFNPFSGAQAFLVGAFVFEDVGVTAYLGAAPSITTPAYLTAAAGIHAVEAYHAAAIRTLITSYAAMVKDPTYMNYANQVSTLRATLGGGNEVPLPTIVPATSANAIAFPRTTDQVLHIVYGTAGGAGVKGGTFFPNGMNGTISTTKA